MPNAISLESVNKRFSDIQALNGISLEVGVGESLALLGPNGAGKTTLISILGGLTRPDQGQARVMGFDVVKDYKESRRAIGIVPQELAFDPFFTVRETLRLQSGYFGLRRNDAWIDTLLENFDLSDKANINMRALSGGMKRRVLVAQALVHRPPVIVLDEPTAGVDVALRHTLWKFIQQLNQKHHHTIILTTHYFEEAETCCERVAMLKRGQIIALDKTANFLKQPRHRQLSLRLSPPELPESLQAFLEESKGEWHVLSIPDIGLITTVMDSLKTAGAVLLDLKVEQPSLEHAFLQLTGDSKNNADEKKAPIGKSL